MIIRVILLLSVLINPIQIEQFLFSKGMKVKVQLVRLGDPLVYGTELDYFNRLLAAFNYTGYRHILLPPFMSNKTEYILGFASGNFSMSVWNERNDRGEDRILHTLSALAHELGHTIFRLKHQPAGSCATLMDAAVLACPNLKDLKFSSAQKLKIDFTIKHRRKKFTKKEVSMRGDE